MESDHWTWSVGYLVRYLVDVYLRFDLEDLDLLESLLVPQMEEDTGLDCLIVKSVFIKKYISSDEDFSGKRVIAKKTLLCSGVPHQYSFHSLSR